MAVAVIISGLGALTGWTMICAEMPLAAAKDGLFPEQFKRMSSKGVPPYGIIASTLLASIAMIINFLGSGGATVFTTLVLMTGITAAIPYGYSALAQIKWRWPITARSRRPTSCETSSLPESPSFSRFSSSCIRATRAQLLGLLGAVLLGRRCPRAGHPDLREAEAQHERRRAGDAAVPAAPSQERGRMKVLTALGGNALLRRGEPMTVENQRANVAVAATHLATVAHDHELVDQPRQRPADRPARAGGRRLRRPAALPARRARGRDPGHGRLPDRAGAGEPSAPSRPIATVLTMVEVDPADPAFSNPTKPIGPQYSRPRPSSLPRNGVGLSSRRRVHAPGRAVAGAPAHRRARRHQLARGSGCDGDLCRRGRDPRWPATPTVISTASRPSSTRTVPAACWRTCWRRTCFVMATDTPAVYLGFGTPDQAAVAEAEPDALLRDHTSEFAAGLDAAQGHRRL